MTVPANGSEPEPDLAESCDYDDPQTITCTLPRGRDVLQRRRAHLLGRAVLVPAQHRDRRPQRLRRSCSARSATVTPTSPGPGRRRHRDARRHHRGVPPQPARPDVHADPDVGAPPRSSTRTPSPSTTSWPTTTSRTWSAPAPTSSASTRRASRRCFEANETYQGTKTPQSSQVFVQYFSDPAPLKTAVEGGQVDIAWRTLSPTDLNSIEEGGKAEVISGKGSEFRYWVWQFVHRRGQGQGDPPGRRADHRPPGDLRQRLRRHRRPVVLHRAPGLRWPEGLLPGEVRRARRRRGQADPRRGGRARPRSRSSSATRRSTTARTPWTRRPSWPTS